ncbi:MAG: glutamate--tRNA ligase [Candidatus Burarchaeum sp.]|nr:glutamate--tRNA ligase [Candidatus Burarchaeum sp.]MDO8339946.1 glutamate--tRNA ligase [Candidatus Burarchaeum sp.]
MASVEDILLKFALKNAHDYGKAQPTAVVGKMLAEMPEAKGKMKEVMQKANEIVTKVNAMKKPELEAALKHYSFEEKKKEERTVKLPNAEQGAVVTRFPPEPSGYPHIGHAKAAWLDYEAARAYGGRMLLRFDDTNPEKESQEYVDAIKEGLAWLGIKWDAETYTSDSMPVLYNYAEQLIDSGDAYICTCPQDEMRQKRGLGEGCECRDRKHSESTHMWRQMVEGNGKHEQGVLRFHGEMDAANTVMRDPVLFRIIEKRHYRQGLQYRLWPLYDFEAPIMDSLEGVTHAMRTKEYELRDELYYSILDVLGLRKPMLIEFSRLAIKNAPISKRLITPLIAEGKVQGWDDPRLPTLAALRRRGILPEAIKKFVLSFGMGKAESEPSMEALLVENKRLLDPTAMRYYFVALPVKLEVKGAPAREAKLKRHPADEKAGFRTMNARGTFFIAGADAANLKQGETFRLKGLYNVKLEGKAAGGLTGTYAGEEPLPEKKLQWVNDKALKAIVLVPRDLLRESGEYDEKSLLVEQGLVEPDGVQIKPGEVVQFERYGFCKLDDKASLQFIFTNP